MSKARPEHETRDGGTLRSRNQEIRRVRIADILEHPQNFRTHDDQQRASLAATVGEIGWYGYPDVFEHPEHPGKVMLVDGELRKEHLIAHYGPDAAIDVNVCDFTPGEAEKALATKDPLAAMAGVDEAKLSELLRSLDAESPDFERLIAELAAAERIDLHPLPADIWDETEIPTPTAALTARWQAAQAGLWEFQGRARHRVLIGDAGNAQHHERLLAGRQPLLLISRPPAGMTGTVYRLFPGPVAYLWYEESTAVEIVGHLHQHGWEIRTQLIWRHESEGQQQQRQEYHAHHSACFYAVRRTAASARWNGSRTESTVWDAPTPGHRALPLHVVGRPIVNHGGPEDAVYDPYAGQSAGSAAIAAERLGRDSYSMEADTALAAVVLERLAREGATLLETPEPE
jgi:hypothetical protein